MDDDVPVPRADGRVVLDKPPVLADGAVGALEIVPGHVDDRSGARAYNLAWVQLLEDGLANLAEGLHAAISVLDDEHLLHVQEVGGNDDIPQRSHGTTPGIANNVGIARIDSKSRRRVDAGVDTGNWTQQTVRVSLCKVVRC